MEEKNFDGMKTLKIFLKSFLIEIIISILGMFILALILSKTNVSDNIMGNTIIGISCFSIILGGLICSRKLEMKGIVSGGIEGIIYMIILYLISSIVSGNFSLGIQGIIMILLRNYISDVLVE